MAAGASVGCVGVWRTAAWYALVFAVFTMAAQWAFGAAGAMGQWQFERAAFEGGAWWQLATSQWVHLSWPHAGMNAAAAALMLLALAGWVDGSTQGAALLGGYAGVALVVALDPACAYYAGASGALHGLLAGSGVAMLLVVGDSKALFFLGKANGLGLAILTVLLAKLFFQQHWAGTPALSWIGIQTYYPSHSAGAAGGALVVALLAAFRYRRQSITST